MAEKVATYEAKDLTLRPSTVGSQAAQVAARRIGAASEQAGRAVREVAQNQEEADRAMGQTQAEFLRFEALEERTTGAGVKYGGGLKDMFQLGGGGNEPNYARLNRLSELQDGTLNIARAARRIVQAQSPTWETVENGVTVMHGAGSPGGKSDVENGVTVLRGGGGQPPNTVPTIEGADGNQPAVSNPSWDTTRDPHAQPEGPGGWAPAYGGYDPNKNPATNSPIEQAPLPVVNGNSSSGDIWPNPQPTSDPITGRNVGQPLPNTSPYRYIPAGMPDNSAQPAQVPNTPSTPAQTPDAPSYWQNMNEGM